VERGDESARSSRRAFASREIISRRDPARLSRERRQIRASANYSPPRRIDDSSAVSRQQSVRSRQRDKYRRVSRLPPPFLPPHLFADLLIRIISRRMRCGSRVARTLPYRVLNCAPARPARYEPQRRSVRLTFIAPRAGTTITVAIVRGMPLVYLPNFQLVILRHVCGFA